MLHTRSFSTGTRTQLCAQPLSCSLSAPLGWPCLSKPSGRTNMAKGGASSDNAGAEPEGPAASDLRSLEGARDALREFARARDWERFHTPRNLLLALVGEVGELSELFRWSDDVLSFSADGSSNLRDELADVLAFLLRLADKCDVDLPAALAHKLAKNMEKYPIESAYGTSRKYTQLSGAASG